MNCGVVTMSLTSNLFLMENIIRYQTKCKSPTQSQVIAYFKIQLRSSHVINTSSKTARIKNTVRIQKGAIWLNETYQKSKGIFNQY